MSSYLVYMFARHPRLLGLIRLGEIGNGPGQVKVYDRYPQLHYYNIKQREKNNIAYVVGQYEHLNDAFTMHMVSWM